jgi:hypothetical protein
MLWLTRFMPKPWCLRFCDRDVATTIFSARCEVWLFFGSPTGAYHDYSSSARRWLLCGSPRKEDTTLYSRPVRRLASHACDTSAKRPRANGISLPFAIRTVLRSSRSTHIKLMMKLRCGEINNRSTPALSMHSRHVASVWHVVYTPRRVVRIVWWISASICETWSIRTSKSSLSVSMIHTGFCRSNSFKALSRSVRTSDSVIGLRR